MRTYPLSVGNPVIQAFRTLYRYMPVSALRKLAMRAMQILTGGFPSKAVFFTYDGRKLQCNLKRLPHRIMFNLGMHEPFETEAVKKILRSGDVVLDVGAYIGWYSTAFAKISGVSGQVHAFEASPNVFEYLRTNCVLNNTAGIILNNVAVGDKEGNVTLYTFSDEVWSRRVKPHIKTSLSNYNTNSAKSFECSMVTLDSYLRKNDIKKVDFLRCDVGGAELSVLKGAESLFLQANPPMLMIELSTFGKTSFGYEPQDVMQWLRQKANYEFYKFIKPGSMRKFFRMRKKITGRIRKLSEPYMIPKWGKSYLLCVIPELHDQRIKGLIIDGKEA